MNNIKDEIKAITKVKNNCYVEIKNQETKCDRCGNPMELKDYYNRKIPILFAKNNKLIKMFFIAPKIRCTHCNHSITFYSGFFENRKLNYEKFSELIELL